MTKTTNVDPKSVRARLDAMHQTMARSGVPIMDSKAEGKVVDPAEAAAQELARECIYPLDPSDFDRAVAIIRRHLSERERKIVEALDDATRWLSESERTTCRVETYTQLMDKCRKALSAYQE